MQKALSKNEPRIRPIKNGFLQGLALTAVLAVLAKNLVALPGLSVIGQLVLAILLGMAWRAVMGVQTDAAPGIQFSSKKLLRLGIILLGMRLNLWDIVQAGPKVLAIAMINIVFAITVVFALSKCFKVEKRLGLLTACGTAICGAAAIVAIAPQVKATDDETAVGVGTIAILGTLFTLVYTLIAPLLHLTQTAFGVFAGGTLHEIAHVIAAAAPVGKEAVDMAVIVKLSRVALLVPVALVIGFFAKEPSERAQGKQASWRDLPIPWFIFGFLAVSAINSLGIFSPSFASSIVTLSYFLMAMAMAGLGLNVDFATFRRMGLGAFLSGLIGSVLLSALGYLLLGVFRSDK